MRQHLQCPQIMDERAHSLLALARSSNCKLEVLWSGGHRGVLQWGGQPPFENLAGLQLFESHRSWTSLSSRNRFNLASDCTFASTTPSLEPTPRECLGARTGVGRSHESRVLMWVIHFCHLFVDALVLFFTLRKCKSRRSQRIDCALQCRLHCGVSLALT